MPKITKTFATAALALILLGAGCAFGGGSQATPEAAVDGFLDAIEAKSKARARAYIHPDSELRENFDEDWKEIVEDLTLRGHTVLDYEDGEVEVELEIEEDGEVETDTETIEVEKVNGKWYIADL